MGGEYPTPSSIRHTSNLPGVGLSVNSGPQSNLSNSHDDSVNIVNTSGGVGPLCGIDFGTRPVPIPQLGLTKFTPLGFHVPQAIKDKIWEGTFVDFSLLYKDTANAVMARDPDQNNLQFAMEGNQLVIKNPKKIWSWRS